MFMLCFPCDLDSVDIGRVGFFVKFALYTNSALNPFVLTFRDIGIRRTIKTILAHARIHLMEPLRRIRSTREMSSQT